MFRDHKDSGMSSMAGSRTRNAIYSARAQGYQLKEKSKAKYIFYNNEDCVMLDGTITDFLSETVISSGAGFNTREFIRLDPNSAYLDQIYQEFIAGSNLATLTHAELLNAVVMFVYNKLGKSNPTDALVIANKANHHGDYADQPVINLDKFVEAGQGVCRHRAMLNAYLLSRLIKDGYLAPGRVYVQRGDMTFPHAWAIYRPFHQPHIFLCDSMWGEKAHQINDPVQFNHLGYTGNIVATIKDKYFETPRYTQCKTHDEKFNFVKNILDQKENDRRRILNEQYVVGSLGAVYNALTSVDVANRDSVYATHQNYNKTLKDIALVEKTEELHRQDYNEIKDENEKQQFIAGLLGKYSKERRVILQRQPRAHLEFLQDTLCKDSPAGKLYYEKFKNYTALLNDIKIEKLCRPYGDLPKNSKPDVRQSFAIDLLNCERYEIKIILRRHSIADLKALQASLQTDSPERAQKYKLNKNYRSLLICIEKEILCRPFPLLDHQEQPACVNKLLHCNPLSQDEYFSAQKTKDIALLHAYLLQNASAYPADPLRVVFSKIGVCLDQRLAKEDNEAMLLRRALTKIRETIAHENLKVLQGCWSCCLFRYKYGTAITVNGQQVRVPKNASKIYHCIPGELELYNKSLSDLRKIFAQVCVYAKDGNAKKSGRDEGTTFKFYNLLATQQNSPKQILTDLSSPHFFGEKVGYDRPGNVVGYGALG